MKNQKRENLMKALSFLMTALFAQSSQGLVVSGSTTISNRTLDTLTVNGSATLDTVEIETDILINGAGTLENVKVGKKLEVNGALTASDTSAQILSVNGALTGKVSISGETQVMGGLTLQSSDLQDLTFQGKSAVMTDCKAKTITVIKNNTFNEVQILELKGTTTVEKIKFESGKGVVKKSPTSTVDTLEGGTIEEVN